MEPFLVNLLPHLIKFVESKSQTLIGVGTEAVAGDVQLHNLILQVLRAVFSNKFFDLDYSLKVVIPILMNLTLCSKFHQNSSLVSILALKQANADLLGSLIERFQHKFSLKVGYAEYLLQNIVNQELLPDSNEGQETSEKKLTVENEPLCIYGCLLCL